MVIRKWKHKSEEQKSTIINIRKLYEGRENAINLFDDYYITVELDYQ